MYLSLTKKDVKIMESPENMVCVIWINIADKLVLIYRLSMKSTFNKDQKDKIKQYKRQHNNMHLQAQCLLFTYLINSFLKCELNAVHHP